LERALGGDDPCGRAEHASTLHTGRARGRVAGGNLAILSALCGTPYEPLYDDAVLVLEDVNEPAYRIDRMLTQLRLGGRRQRCAAIVFGAFTDAPADAPEQRVGARPLEAVLAERVERRRRPCRAG